MIPLFYVIQAYQLQPSNDSFRSLTIMQRKVFAETANGFSLFFIRIIIIVSKKNYHTGALFSRIIKELLKH